MPYVSAPFDNVAGFSANQLSIPASHQAHLMPPVFSQVPIMQTYSAPGLDPVDAMDVDNDITREGSPELVDINAVPSISLTHAQPTPMPLPIPCSAMPENTFSTLTQGSTTMVMPSPQPDRLHSAPPFLTRFNSTPNFHTSSTWDHIEPYQGPGGYGDAHSLGGGRSGEDEDWEELENQMISRDASVGIDEEATPSPVEESKMLLTESMKLPRQDDGNQWGQPVVYPQAPRENALRVFSSASSSISTTSTLVNPPMPMTDMSPIDQAQGYQPMTYPHQPMPISTQFTPN